MEKVKIDQLLPHKVKQTNHRFTYYSVTRSRTLFPIRCPIVLIIYCIRVCLTIYVGQSHKTKTLFLLQAFVYYHAHLTSSPIQYTHTNTSFHPQGHNVVIRFHPPRQHNQRLNPNTRSSHSSHPFHTLHDIQVLSVC